jgi:hypothetical protein
MTNDYDNAAPDIVAYSKLTAEQMLLDMSKEECVAMVRDFCQLMQEWQPNIAVHDEDPVMTSITCLAAAELFKLAFVEAYNYTDEKISTIDSLNKAFDNS